MLQVGKRKSNRVSVRGRAVLDVYLWMLNNFRLDEYKLDAVCRTFLGDHMTKEDLHFTEITPKWLSGTYFFLCPQPSPYQLDGRPRGEEGIGNLLPQGRRVAPRPDSIPEHSIQWSGARSRHRFALGVGFESRHPDPLHESFDARKCCKGLFTASHRLQLAIARQEIQVYGSHCPSCAERPLALGCCVGLFIHVPLSNYRRKSVLQHIITPRTPFRTGVEAKAALLSRPSLRF